MSHLWVSIRFLTLMMVLTGFVYPVSMTYLSMMIFHDQATGSLLTHQGKLVGSSLIAQKVQNPKYFWSRPSAVDFNPLPSSGSNLSPASQTLRAAVSERKAALVAAHGTDQTPPQDLWYASGSGLDPHISLDAAHYQLTRVSKFRNLSSEKVKDFVFKHTEGPQYGLFGEERVNVLKLNLALDQNEPNLK